MRTGSRRSCLRPKPNFFAGIPQSMLFGYRRHVDSQRRPHSGGLHPGPVSRQQQAHAQCGAAIRPRSIRARVREDPNPDKNNFGPRLGAAYAFSPRTALHAAGGVFYGQIFGSLLQNNRQAQARRQYTVDGAAARSLWAEVRNNMDGRDNRPAERNCWRRRVSGRSISHQASPRPISTVRTHTRHRSECSISWPVTLPSRRAISMSGSRHEGVGRDVNWARRFSSSEGQAMPNGLVGASGRRHTSTIAPGAST